jgi:DNA mismatch repair ATPase MutS
MLLKRISQKSIAEEYIIFDNVATIFRLRMNEFWFLKYKDITSNKLVKKSLNTKTFEDALRISLLSLRSLSSFDSVKSFDKSFLLSELIDNYLVFQNERVLNFEITKPRYNVLKIQLRKHLVNFIGNGNKFHGLLMVVNNIDADIFKNYFSFRMNSEKKLSSNTLKNELNCFKNFFSWCNKYYFNNAKNFIFPKEFKETISKRKGITPLEFFRIQAALKRWPDKALSHKDSYYKKIIRDFLFIQSSFLLSFSELKKLKWEDVSLIVKDQELTAKITIKNGKNIRVV